MAGLSAENQLRDVYNMRILSNLTVKAGDVVEIRRKQSFKTISTHKHYPDRHKIKIIVNGQAMAEFDFECD